MKTVTLEFTEEEIKTLHMMIAGSLKGAIDRLESLNKMVESNEPNIMQLIATLIGPEITLEIIQAQIEVGLEIQKKVCFVTHSGSETDHKAM